MNKENKSQRTQRWLLSAGQVAKLLGISERFLWGFTQSGEIPSVRIGKRVLYDPSDVRQWVESRKQAHLQTGEQGNEVI